MVEEISSKWGGDQTIFGPILSVPYYHTIKQDLIMDVHRLPRKNNFFISYQIISKLMQLSTGIKYRGIFETVVYKSIIEIRGSFSKLDWNLANVEEHEILKEQTSLCIGIPDVRGIREATTISLLGKELEALPGLHTQDVLKSGLSARVDLTDSNETMEFEFYLHLDGSSSLAFSPLGKTTSVKMKSPWIS